MTVNSKLLQPVPQSEEERRDNGFEKLRPLLDPAVLNAPHLEHAWKKLDRKLVAYLTNTVAKINYPWLNHLSLVANIYSGSGAISPINKVEILDRFLRWVISKNYPNVTSSDPAGALIDYFGDPPKPRGLDAFMEYSSQQLHVQGYLSSLSKDECKKLEAFILPLLLGTPRLTKLGAHVVDKRKSKRKEQAHAVVRDLVSLITMSQRRYKWLADLDTQLQRVPEEIKSGQVTLPAVIHCRDLGNCQDLTFRVWNRKSWMEAHQGKYSKSALRKDSDGVLFLQLVGALPDTPWFLRAAELGVLTGEYSVARKYLKGYNAGLFRGFNGLLRPRRSLTNMLYEARPKAKGTSDDSRILFLVEPLLAAAALGLFTLVSLTQTGMRIGELQQVSLDETCIRIGHVPQFDGQHGKLSQELMFWYLYPKGKTDDRQPYAVTHFMQEAMALWMQTYERFCGEWKQVSASDRKFSHDYKFPGEYKFAFQWSGRHLSREEIQSCLDFVLLEHTCLDSSGKPTRITAHVLRHGVAGYLRSQGVPLQDIMALLKQVNIEVTAYYSEPSKEDLYRKVGPVLTRLGDLLGMEIDPATIRTPADIEPVRQEALKHFGMLLEVAGGNCCSLQSCVVQFQCASCSLYVPDPTRRHEVENKIAFIKNWIQMCEAKGDHIQARILRSQLHSWQRVLKEIEALKTVQLETRPLGELLTEVGVNKVSDESLLLLMLPGDHEHD
jgi:integrase